MTCSDSTERAQLIDGLRRLADYLESNPQLPAPSCPAVYAFPPASGWAEMRAEIDATAARMGVLPHLAGGGHYVATRSFGPVQYRAVAIPAKNDSASEKGQ